MSREKLRQIFIEEANEIIEKMDVDIINYEESPSDKALLNEIFRGVHTLKGSANAFNFSRLGEFVHHFEDVLDFFRNSASIPDSNDVDLFLEGVNVIKETLLCEVDEKETLPQDYAPCLEKIRQILLNVNKKEDTTASSTNDLSLEFGNEAFGLETTSTLCNEEAFLEKLQGTEMLYKIVLKLDEDIYLRGFDHFLFFKNLSRIGRILASYWSIPTGIEEEVFDVERNAIKEVTLYFASEKDAETVADVFAFLDEEEFLVQEVKVAPVIVETGMVQEHKAVTPVEEKDDKNSKSSVITKNFLKIDALKLDELFDSIGELVIAQNYLAENAKIKAIQDADVSKTIENLSKITRLIQNRVMSLRMIPIRDTFEKMKYGNR